MHRFLLRIITAVQLTRLTMAFGAVSDVWFVILLTHTDPQYAHAEVNSINLWLALLAGAVVAVGLFAYGAHCWVLVARYRQRRTAGLAALIERARRDGLRHVIVQPQLAPASAQVIADEIGARVIVADPLAANWADELRRIAALVASRGAP